MQPQRAYTVNYDDWRHGEYSSEDVATLTLPQVKCRICGASESDQHAWYPTLQESISEIQECVSGLTGNASVVSSECYSEMRNTIRKLAKRELWLPGRSQLGTIRATMKSFHRPRKFQEKLNKLPDLFECADNILISSKGIRALKSKGFEVTSGPAVVVWNGVIRDDYLAVELEPRSLHTSSSEKAWDTWTCEFCGAMHLKPQMRGGNPWKSDYDIPKFPASVGIARERESGLLLASEDFRIAVETLGLTGFTFTEAGKFIAG